MKRKIINFVLFNIFCLSLSSIALGSTDCPNLSFLDLGELSRFDTIEKDNRVWATDSYETSQSLDSLFKSINLIKNSYDDEFFGKYVGFRALFGEQVSISFDQFNQMNARTMTDWADALTLKPSGRVGKIKEYFWEPCGYKLFSRGTYQVCSYRWNTQFSGSPENNDARTRGGLEGTLVIRSSHP